MIFSQINCKYSKYYYNLLFVEKVNFSIYFNKYFQKSVYIFLQLKNTNSGLHKIFSLCELLQA